MPEYPSSGGGAAGVAVAGHTANSVPVASGSTSLADLDMAASTILARLAAGDIVAATPAQLKTLLAIAEADVTGLVADLAAKADAAATAAALALLAPLASPTFTGVATAPSVSASGKPGATAQATVLAGGTASAAPTTGAHVVGELVADATGRLWYCAAAGTPGTWVLGGPPTLIGFASYSPNPLTTYTRNNASFADVDAANLAVSFSAPPSGKVLIVCSATANAGGQPMRWNLRESTTNLVGTVGYAADNNAAVRLRASAVVSGLAPGAAKTYKWGWRSGGATSTLYAGGPADDTDIGPAIMEVWAVNL